MIRFPWTSRALPLSMLAISASALVGCATAPPPRELLEARTTYARVASGPAAQLKPDDLLTAKQELDRAERSYKNNGDAPATKDAGYIAIRKALFAESAANTVAASKAKSAADAATVAQQSADLTKTKGQLAQTQQALDKERTAREDAEKKAAAAMADLQKIAAVKKDDRGTVITLSGGVLFKTDQSELLPAAMVSLNSVADALARTSPDSKIVVGGYTDSQGTEAHNQQLSEKRAASVAAYLVSRGIAPDRISSKGFGTQNPVADNKSVEGRAQNRRVEIVVDNPK